MMEWINGNTYPCKSGIYEAEFTSGITRMATFTHTPSNWRDYGKWGLGKVRSNNYEPLIDPVRWRENNGHF